MVRRSMTFRFGQMTGLNGTQLTTKIQTIMNMTMALTQKDMLENIEIIPKDTGAMRESVRQNIAKTTQSKMTGQIGFIYFGSDMPYTKYVEDMPTYGRPHVRHPPHNSKASEHLYDPLAEGHPFAWMAAFAKGRLKLNWNKAKFAITGVP